MTLRTTRCLLLGPLLCTVALTACGKSTPPPSPPAAKPVKAKPVEAAVMAAGDRQREVALAVTVSRTEGFVVVPPGKFTMGVAAAELEEGVYNDAPPHEVSIQRTFEMAATEVTQAQFRKWMGRLPNQPKGCDTCPVVQVSWYDAAAYCNALSQSRGLPACHGVDVRGGMTSLGPGCNGFRLPTEAEWEYAARAGSTAARYGEEDAVAWFDMNSGDGQALVPRPVGGKAANAWGLFDMLGNAAEWVADWQGPYATEPVADPQGPASSQNRVFRGGSYKMPAGEATAGWRNAYGPAAQVEFIGFRCVRSL